MHIKNVILFLVTTLFSVLSFADDDFSCKLFNGTLDDGQFVAYVGTNLPDSGSVAMTEADATLKTPELSNLSFSVATKKVWDNVVISSMKLEIKNLGIIAEQSDSAVGQVKTLILKTKDQTLTLFCSLNII